VAIRTDGLVKAYKRRNVVDGVSISVDRGEIVGLLGPNGAGKTTTFYMIVGLISPKAGKVFLDGQDITRLPMHMRARRGIGYLSQEPSIFRKLSVEDNVRLVLELSGKDGKATSARVDSLLDELSIGQVRRQMGYQLSGGERRRVEIARALATSPSFILLDEPFTGIDPISIKDIHEIILHLKSKDIGILITDHSVREMFQSIDRAYVMYDGRIMASGRPDDVLSDEEARRRYFGEDFRL
jgi:lipopolysaccharide export system ATP-binding protein